VTGFEKASAETLRVIEQNLLAGLTRVAGTIVDGTFHTCGPKGSAPPSQSGQLTLVLLDGVRSELATRTEQT
jgi:hypothetical protein